MIAEGDRVAVRWQLTATYQGRPFEQSIMAIYRSESGRIAEDCGHLERGTLALRLGPGSQPDPKCCLLNQRVTRHPCETGVQRLPLA